MQTETFYSAWCIKGGFIVEVIILLGPKGWIKVLLIDRETSTGRGNSMSIDRGVLFISTLFCSNRTSPSTPKLELLNKKKHTIYSYTMHEVNTVALVFSLTSKHATEVLSQLLF